MNRYSRNQIQEAICHWKKMLNEYETSTTITEQQIWELGNNIDVLLQAVNGSDDENIRKTSPLMQRISDDFKRFENAIANYVQTNTDYSIPNGQSDNETPF